MAKKTKQEAQQERLALAEKRNRQERRNKKSRKEREQEKRRKKQERDRRKQKNIPTTAQQSIPYIRMLQDGICQVTKTFFSKTIQFYDIRSGWRIVQSAKKLRTSPIPAASTSNAVTAP